MPTSYNVLKDIEITVEPIPSEERMNYFRSTIRAKVHCIRELTGAAITTVHLHAFAHSHSREHAIISAINEILDGNFAFTETVHYDEHYHEVDYSKVHAIESHGMEEHADLFHKHFDLLKFSFPEVLQQKDAAMQDSADAETGYENSNGE